MNECIAERRNSPELRAGIQAGAATLAELPDDKRKLMAYAFAYLKIDKDDGLAGVPGLSTLVSSRDPELSTLALGALTLLDPDTPKWATLLHQSVEGSSNKKLSEFAERALIRAGK